MTKQDIIERCNDERAKLTVAALNFTDSLRPVTALRHSCDGGILWLFCGDLWRLLNNNELFHN